MSKLLIPSTDSLQAGRLDARQRTDQPVLSVIVPVGYHDDSWRALLPTLASLDSEAEICVVATEPEPGDLPNIKVECGITASVEWIVATPGRAHQLNVGAAHARGSFLWFVHADSQVGTTAIEGLKRAIATRSSAVYFFDLSFDRTGPSLVRLNELGVRFRSRVLGLPFGDQAFCMHRSLFERLGPFNERVTYGEDHLLVWNCRHQAIPLRPVGVAIVTSSRKYSDRGWLPTTVLHVWRTWRQAFPQFMRLVWGRMR